jgi:nucleoside-diphosphate-sugar epimerase
VHARPRPPASLPLPEDLPLRADPDSALTGDLLEVERLADHATRTGLEVLVLRPAAVVGGRSGRRTTGRCCTRWTGPRLLAVRGVEPLWQVCHSDDLLSALELAATGRTCTGAARSPATGG